jgi:tRNA-intron endonuclease
MLLSIKTNLFFQVKASFDGEWVCPGEDGTALYENSGYGRPDGNRLKLFPEEALYLAGKGKLTVDKLDFDALAIRFSEKPGFMRRFLVYRDIRERGLVIQTGPQDFRVFRRGEKPGKGRSQYLIRVLSERDYIDFEAIAADSHSAANMRKQFVVAVVDDENEITYYEIKTNDLPEGKSCDEIKKVKGQLTGNSVFVMPKDGKNTLPEGAMFGTWFDDKRLVLSPLETLYLLDKGLLEIEGGNEKELREILEEEDPELPFKMTVYESLRDSFYIPRTAYKFGHHFRVYNERSSHSAMLVHAIPGGSGMPMSRVSRSVRLAHSVRKKMLFACVKQNNIEYIEFARIKL